VTREFPFERLRDRLVMPLEGKEALADRSQGRKVVGRQNFSLQDGKVDLDLVEPAGVDGTVNRDDAGIFFHQAFHAGSAAMGGPVVHDPEHAPCLVVGRLGHHLGDQSVKGDDPGLSFAPTEELGPANVERREVRPSPAPTIFVFHPHRFPGLRRKGGMPACAGLNGGLLVRGQNELVAFRRFSLKDPLVEVEDAGGFGRKVRIARKNPAPVLPGFYRILGKPAPDGAVADGGRQSGLPDLPGHVGGAHPGEWNPQRSGQFTGDGLDVDDEFRGEKPGGGRGAAARPAPAGVARRTAFATSTRSPVEHPGGRRSPRWTIPRPPKGSSWHGPHDNTATNTLPRAASVRSSLPERGESDRGLISAWRRPSLVNTMPYPDAHGKL